MKSVWLICFFTFSSLLSIGQNAFSLKDSVIRLYKDTDASPVHWYAEIYSHVNVDTGLVWRAEFSPTWPSNWQLTFDDQNNFYPAVKHQDSASFTLYANPTFPQKLIIGNKLNNTVGIDSVDFLIYHPHQPQSAEILRFVFYISEGQQFSLVEQAERVYYNAVLNKLEGDLSWVESYALFDLSGRIIQQAGFDEGIINLNSLNTGLYILQLKANALQTNFVKHLKILKQ